MRDFKHRYVVAAAGMQLLNFYCHRFFAGLDLNINKC